MHPELLLGFDTNRIEAARQTFWTIRNELNENYQRLRRTMQEIEAKPRPMRVVSRDPIADAVQKAVARCKDSGDYRVCLSEFIVKLVDDGWLESDANQVTKPALEAIREHRAQS